MGHDLKPCPHVPKQSFFPVFLGFTARIFASKWIHWKRLKSKSVQCAGISTQHWYRMTDFGWQKTITLNARCSNVESKQKTKKKTLYSVPWSSKSYVNKHFPSPTALTAHPVQRIHCFVSLNTFKLLSAHRLTSRVGKFISVPAIKSHHLWQTSELDFFRLTEFGRNANFIVVLEEKEGNQQRH